MVVPGSRLCRHHTIDRKLSRRRKEIQCVHRSCPRDCQLMGAGKYGGRVITETAFVSVRTTRVRISERANTVDGNIVRRATSLGMWSSDHRIRWEYSDWSIITGIIVYTSTAAAATADSGDSRAQRKCVEQLTRNGGKHTTTIRTFQPPLHLPVYWSQD